VTVDLKARKIVYKAGTVTVEARIEGRLRSITHVGYAMDTAVIEFAPVEIQIP